MKDFAAWFGLGVIAMAFAGGMFRFFDWLRDLYRVVFPLPANDECDHTTLVQDRPGRAHCPECDRVWTLMQPGVHLNQTPGTFS